MENYLYLFLPPYALYSPPDDLFPEFAPSTFICQYLYRKQMALSN